MQGLYKGLRSFWVRRWREAWIVSGWLTSVGISVWVWLDHSSFPPILWLDPEKLPGAIYSAWVGGVAIFTVVGAVAALVSLTRPEEESFDSRARILFRRQAGPHIDYIISRIRAQFEHYSERTTIRVEIRDFHDGQKKYRVAETTFHTLKSYINDIPTSYVSDMRYAELTPPPPNGPSNRLVFVRLNGIAIGSGTEMVGDFKRQVSTTIYPRTACVAESKVELWLQATDEPNEFEPLRYTQSMTLEFENDLPHPVAIKFVRDGGEQLINLASGEANRISLNDLRPGENAYVYYVLGP